MSGRARDNRLVHFNPGGTAPRPGDVVTTTVTSTAPHYLIADGEPLRVRRTRAGDAWQVSQQTSALLAHGGATHLSQAPMPVLLGMPSRRG
jgi:tRNA-2-methylthio-N6-dimethylallyladenosine synthase